jgi:hypothetical protein
MAGVGPFGTPEAFPFFDEVLTLYAVELEITHV